MPWHASRLRGRSQLPARVTSGLDFGAPLGGLRPRDIAVFTHESHCLESVTHVGANPLALPTHLNAALSRIWTSQTLHQIRPRSSAFFA